MEDIALGRVFRQVRVRRGWRQVDVADRAHVSRSTYSETERGHLDACSLSTLRRVAAVLEVRLTLEASWRGGDLGRLLSSRHSAMANAVAGRLVAAGWLVRPEVSFNHFGEWGSSTSARSIRSGERCCSSRSRPSLLMSVRSLRPPIGARASRTSSAGPAAGSRRGSPRGSWSRTVERTGGWSALTGSSFVPRFRGMGARSRAGSGIRAAPLGRSGSCQIPASPTLGRLGDR